MLKIYKAKWLNGRWDRLEELSFNTDANNTAHPALTPDGKWLYFASDRELSKGQSDLYKVEINEDGTYGEPIHLEGDINTEGRESFPLISDSNELYFSSDGRPGLGGLDVYVTHLERDGSLGEIHNLGAPINSSKDDFAFYMDNKTQKGYISSNRNYGNGSDDIYAITQLKPFCYSCDQIIFGSIRDRASQQPLSEVDVELYDKHGVLQQTKSDSEGNYRIENLACETYYELKVSKTAYTQKKKLFATDKTSAIEMHDFNLSLAQKLVSRGDDLGEKLKLDPIYFKFDHFDIEVESEVDLALVLEWLEANPHWNLEIRAHTDTRGTTVYNQTLSELRAVATEAWFLEKGLTRNRVRAKGMGESEPLIYCGEVNPCTEQEHALNRRSEFIVYW